MTKLRYVQVLFLLSLLFVVLTSSELGRATDDNIGNTGAPLETQVCANCHNSGTGFGVVTLTIEVFYDGTTTPVPAYTPGTLYDMRVTVNNSAGNPAGRGFQMTCLKFPSNQPVAGYSALGSNCQQITLTSGTWAGRTYVEQNTMSVSNQFNFSWTAPVAGTGTVKFYAAGNAVNGNNSSSGDKAGNTNITLPELLPLVISNSTVSNVSCFGLNNGSISLTTSGGITPYTILWDDGTTTEDRSALQPGDYSVTITDALGTIIMQDFSISEPAQLVATSEVVNPIFPDENGIVDFEISGGTPGYELNVAGVGTFTSFPFELPNGLYDYTLTDANNCLLTGMLEVIVPPSLVVVSDVQDISCNGFSDGSIALEISGATPPYQIEWSNDGVGESISNLSGGEYEAVITDDVGYIVVLDFEIEEPAVLEVFATPSSIPCSGGTSEVVFDATGGTLPYTGTGIFTREAGLHVFEITDANGCFAQTEITITEPEPLIASATSDAIFCLDDVGEIFVTAIGGTEPYSGIGEFEVTTPGQIPFFVTDANGCTSTALADVLALDGPSVQVNSTPPLCSYSCDGIAQLTFTNVVEPYTLIWNDGSELESRNDLCAGQYSIVLTDSTGCTVNSTIIVEAPDSLQLTFDVPEIFCYGGTVVTQANALGGIIPYLFMWDDGITTAENFTTAGIYFVQVTDANDCFVTDSVLVMQQDSIVLTATIINPLCNGDAAGSIDLSVEGGLQPYNFTWQDTTFTEDLSGLAAGEYHLEVMDANGCTSNAIYQMAEPQILVIAVDEFTTGNDGTASVDVAVIGGTQPYSFNWNDGQSTEDVELQTGSWTLVVTDANGCVVSSEVFNVPEAIMEIHLPSFEIYPNPATDYFEVQSDIASIEIILVNQFGEIVLNSSTKNGKLLADVQGISAGVYTLLLLTHSRSIARSLVLIGQ